MYKKLISRMVEVTEIPYSADDFSTYICLLGRIVEWSNKSFQARCRLSRFMSTPTIQ